MAKAVRIRIKSGGETHNSLESLLQNFSIQDILPLMDGRLSRWLEQNGQTELSNEMEQYTEEGYKPLLRDHNVLLGFCRRFFIHSTNEEINNFFEDSGGKKTQLSDFISFLLNTGKYQKSAYNLWLYSFCPIPLKEFKRIISLCPNEAFQQLNSFTKENPNDAHAQGWLGMCYKEGIGSIADLIKAKSCFEKVKNPWAERRLEEIKNALNDKTLETITNFSVEKARKQDDPNPGLPLLEAINSFYEEEGNIDHEKIDNALRKFSKDAHTEEITAAAEACSINPIIGQRLLGLAIESTVKSGIGSSRIPAYYSAAKRVAPKGYEDARLAAYLAWYKNNKELSALAKKLSHSTTEEVVAILKNRELSTGVFASNFTLNQTDVKTKYSSLFQSISDTFTRQKSINLEWIDKQLRGIVSEESHETLSEIIDTDDFLMRARAKILGFIMEKYIPDQFHKSHMFTCYFSHVELKNFLAVDARLCAYYAYWMWNTVSYNRDEWEPYARQARQLNSDIVLEVISHLESRRLSSHMLKSDSKQNSFMSEFGL